VRYFLGIDYRETLVQLFQRNNNSSNE
jgi:hypothetical protein